MLERQINRPLYAPCTAWGNLWQPALVQGYIIRKRLAAAFLSEQLRG